MLRQCPHVLKPKRVYPWSRISSFLLLFFCMLSQREAVIAGSGEFCVVALLHCFNARAPLHMHINGRYLHFKSPYCHSSTLSFVSGRTSRG